MKAEKKSPRAHNANVSRGMGDYYGSGIRNPMGKIRDLFGATHTLEDEKKVKQPPKKIA